MNIEKELDASLKEFKDYIGNTKDPVSAFLRVHLIIEKSLERIIRMHLQSPDTLLKDGRLNFSQKILLVGSFNILDKKVYNAIRHLNRIRNDLAHDIEYDLDKDSIEKLGNELRPWFTDIKKRYPEDHLEWLGRVLPHLAGNVASHTIQNEENG